MHLGKASDIQMRRLLSTVFPILLILTVLFMVDIDPMGRYSYRMNQAVSVGALLVGSRLGFRFRSMFEGRLNSLEGAVGVMLIAALATRIDFLLACAGPFSLGLLGTSLGVQAGGIPQRNKLC